MLLSTLIRYACSCWGHVIDNASSRHGEVAIINTDSTTGFCCIVIINCTTGNVDITNSVSMSTAINSYSDTAAISSFVVADSTAFNVYMTIACYMNTATISSVGTVSNNGT